MLVIAERINATRSAIARALEERDADLLAQEAQTQADAGADFIDVNAGKDPAKEPENLAWAVRVVQEATDLPLCVDSSNPEALEVALDLVERRPVMLNSVTAEPQRMQQVLPLAADSGARLVALTMDEGGLPKTAEERVDIADRLVEAATEAGVEVGRLYVDPCIQPVSTNPEQGMEVIGAVFRVMEAFPGIHTTGGLSNVSFGLPRRNVVNRTFLAQLIAAGLDSAIMDPTAEGMMETVLAGEALAGRDDFCMNYVRAMRD